MYHAERSAAFGGISLTAPRSERFGHDRPRFARGDATAFAARAKFARELA